MDKNMMNIDVGYNNNGAFLKLEIHIPYNELKTFRMPRSCTGCPCGYMDYKCGRNVPFKDEDYDKRPSTCKLEKISIENIIEMVNKIGK